MDDDLSINEVFRHILPVASYWISWFWSTLINFGWFWLVMAGFGWLWWLWLLVHGIPWDPPITRSAPHAPIVLQLPPDRSHWTRGRPWKLRSPPWCATWCRPSKWSKTANGLLISLQKGVDWNSNPTKEPKRPTFWRHHQMEMIQLGSASQCSFDSSTHSHVVVQKNQAFCP